MDDELHSEDVVGVPGELVKKGPPWGAHETWECKLCPPGWTRELNLERMAIHLEKDHEVMLGERETTSSILGPDGQPLRRTVPAPVFSGDGGTPE